jgi:ZIP family zinc transporter
VVFISIYLLSLIAGLLTGVGALITIIIKKPDNKMVAFFLGFASGVMLGISMFSLIPESLALGKVIYCLSGLIVGALFLAFLEYLLPYFYKNEGVDDPYRKIGYLIALGIGVHNLPEGMAIGASNEVSLQLGFSMALSIGIHNIAEGFSVALPLSLSPEIRKSRIVLITTLAGLVTLLGTFLGTLMANISLFFIAFSLSFAAGAMIYIVAVELLPQSYRLDKFSTNAGLVVGIALALLLG